MLPVFPAPFDLAQHASQHAGMGVGTAPTSIQSSTVARSAYSIDQAPTLLTLKANPAVTVLPPAWTFLVGGTGGSRYFFDSLGNYRAAAANELRHVYDAPVVGGDGAYKGILLEPFSANVIRISGNTGASAPNSLPTNWSHNAAVAGLSLSVRTGSERGISYVEVTISGTPTASSVTILHDVDGAITSAPNSAGGSTAIAAGQKWTASALVKVISNSGVSAVQMAIIESGSNITTTGRIPRETTYGKGHATAVLSSGVTSINAATVLSVTIGTPVSIKFRIGQVQLEPNGYASSYIPTAGSAASRASDQIVCNGASFSSAFPANKQGSIYFEYIEPYWVTDGGQRQSFVIYNQGTNGRLALEAVNNNSQLIMCDWNGTATTTEAVINTNNPIKGRIVKTAMRFGSNDIAFARDNLPVKVDTSVNFFTYDSPTQLLIGQAKPIIFRGFSLFADKKSDYQLANLARNYENFVFVDEFNRKDSSTLGVSPVGLPWVQYGVGVRPGVKTSEISAGVCVTSDNGMSPDCSAYNGVDYGRIPVRMAALIRFDPATNPGASPLDGVAALISSPSGLSVPSILAGSVHIAYSGQAVLAGFFNNGSLSTDRISFSPISADGVTPYYFGWEIVDGELWFELPDGRSIKTTAFPESYASKLGRYLTFETFWAPGQNFTAFDAVMAA